MLFRSFGWDFGRSSLRRNFGSSLIIGVSYAAKVETIVNHAKMIFVVRLEFCVADLDVPKETLLDDIEVAPTMLMLSPYEYREFVIYIGPERIAALLTVDEPAIGRIEAPVDQDRKNTLLNSSH